MKKLMRALLVIPAVVALAAVLYLHASPAQQSPASDPQACAIDQGSDVHSTAASCGRCGDGQCVPQCGETASSCPQDCGTTTAASCGRCGDGQCVPQCGETAQSCPQDCGTTSL
jgi:uncharacterized low-complexity protein